METKKTLWLDLLIRIDKLNRKVKEPGWNYSDKKMVYDIKDDILAKILNNASEEIELSCFYVPYYMYSAKSKDKAGALMRSDTQRKPFEYYLSLIEPCELDIEVPEKATVEMIIKCDDLEFSFHQPIDWYDSIKHDAKELPKKAWISAPNFYHSLVESESKAINDLCNKIF